MIHAGGGAKGRARENKGFVERKVDLWFRLSCKYTVNTKKKKMFCPTNTVIL